MTTEGYIKSYRPKKDDPLYFKEPFTKWQAWHDLIFLALWKDTQLVVRSIVVAGKRGCVYVSQNTLSERWKWDKKKVIRFLKMLEKLGRVTLQKSNVINTISINNYEKYQPNDTPNDTPNAPHKKNIISKEDNKEILEVSNETSSSSANAEDGFSLTPPPTEIISKNRKEKIDCNKFVDFWNKTVASTRVPQIKKLADARRNALCARMSTYGKKAIFEAVEKIPKSDFLSGGATDFKVTFDWVFGPKNFPKVLDGNYDNDNFKDNDNRRHTQDRRRGYDARTHSAEEYEKDF